MKTNSPAALSAEKHLRLRQNAKVHLLANPNYFGNLTELDLPGTLPPVLPLIQNTTYEELTCLGYNPQTRLLTAIVEVKLSSGYSGGPCTDGSEEYVRFYLDYGDGVWVDHGQAAFTAHDLGFKEDLCYAVSIRLDAKRRSCCDAKPVLPKVRAILSWNFAPPANQPNWAPVWGNRLEREIQIEPRSHFLCHILDKLDLPGIQKINPALLAHLKAVADTPLNLPNPPEPVQKIVTKEMVRSDEMGAFRNMFAALATPQTAFALQTVQAQAPWLKDIGFDLSKFADFLAQPKFNTTYEELHCVGLDRDQSTLHGVIQIKRPSGYSGGMCSAGSREYVAFFLDFGSGWEYQGTSSVIVHDVAVPAGGLWYQVALPVTLDAHRMEWCKTGKARIRGVLSWQTAPTTDPDFVPPWGDREDCHIEIRPLPKGVTPGVFTPFLASIGNMSVTKIDWAGYANGTAEGGIYGATDSPFGGLTTLKGEVFNLPGGPLEYRVMIQGPSDPSPRAWTAPFTASVTTFPSIFPVDQTVSATGDWFPYLEADPNVRVSGDLLGVLSGLETGLNRVYLEFRQPMGPVLATTVSKAFMVDNTGPSADVEITSGGGNCSKFKVGEVIVGTYAMSDLHAGGLTLQITPAAAAAGGHLAITSALPAAPFPAPLPGPTASNGLSYPLTLTTFGASGNWELDTTGMDPCGYNIRLVVADRTIVHSAYVGFTNEDIEGFCLDKP